MLIFVGVDSDAALLFNGVGVHGRTFRRSTCLFKDGVRQGGLAVVHVCNDCDVSNFHSGSKNWPLGQLARL